jgi:ElaB/YqjD/DUF883 family membrane-anchored ribosome-binding protein
MKSETESATQTAEDVLNELRALVGEAEKILGQTREENSNCESTVAALRERLAEAQERLGEVYQDARQKVVAGAKYTDAKIRENPYPSIAIALGAGLLAGVLLGRRGNSRPQ